MSSECKRQIDILSDQCDLNGQFRGIAYKWGKQCDLYEENGYPFFGGVFDYEAELKEEQEEQLEEEGEGSVASEGELEEWERDLDQWDNELAEWDNELEEREDKLEGRQEEIDEKDGDSPASEGERREW